MGLKYINFSYEMFSDGLYLYEINKFGRAESHLRYSDDDLCPVSLHDQVFLTSLGTLQLTSILFFSAFQG